MVKLGKAFSIVVVFTLLILLAPVAILAPPVASAADPLPNPLTVTFDADVDYLGVPISFNAVPNITYKNGSIAIQLSRDSVMYTNNLTGCKFHNISAASGTVGGDLSGGIELEWGRIDLTMQHPNSSQWFDVGTPDGFGLLYIKGNLTTSELGNFKFVAGADHDYKGTETKGAGRICTVIPWAAPPANGSLQQVLIGEITSYTLTASKISGTLNLRYYNLTKGEISNNWNKMGLEGWFGGDAPDNITTPPGTVDLLQFTTPNLVPTWSNKTAGMEENHPGGENPLRLVSGFLGPNGTVTLNRTGVMPYVHVGTPPNDMNLPSHSCHLVRMTLNNWIGNDTTKRGRTQSVLAVNMAGFTGTTVDQHAYAFAPTYSPGYEGEGYLKGFESFSMSLTKLYIDPAEFVAGDYYDFRLIPTPIVTSVSPVAGYPGQSFEVTITGKWLLLDTNYHNLTITFGPGITVDWPNATVDSDTQARVNITITGGAATGLRDVNVTKMDGGPTGTLSSGFGVGATLQGHVSLQGRPAPPNPQWVVDLTLKFFNATTKVEETWSPVNATTDQNGNFSVGGFPNATYDICAKSPTTLSRLKSSEVVPSVTTVDFGTLLEGDANSFRNWIEIDDYIYTVDAFDSIPGAGNWNAACDFNLNSWIDIDDYIVIVDNFDKLGECGGTVWP